MKRTFTAWLAAGALAAIGDGLPAGAQSVTPSATDKVTINGWALNMSNIATGANQTIRINIDRLVESVAAPAPDRHLSREEAGRAAARARKAARARPVQLPRLHGPRPEQHHASWHRHPLRHELPRRGRRPAHRHHHAPRDRLPRDASTSRARSTIPSRCSRCGSTRPARAKAGWPTRRRSSSTRRPTRSSSRTIRASRCG